MARHVHIPDVVVCRKIHITANAGHIVSIATAQHTNIGQAATKVGREEHRDGPTNVLHVGIPVVQNTPERRSDVTRIRVNLGPHAQVRDLQLHVRITLIHGARTTDNGDSVLGGKSDV